jgi:hypothetical protein
MPATANSAYVLNVRNILNPEEMMTVCLSADGSPIDYETLTREHLIKYTTNSIGNAQTQLTYSNNVPMISIELPVSGMSTQATLNVYDACMAVGEVIRNVD